MEAQRTLETFIPTYLSTRYSNAEQHKYYRHQNLKSFKTGAPWIYRELQNYLAEIRAQRYSKSFKINNSIFS